MRHGTRTAVGSRVFALLASVIETCRRRAHAPWPYKGPHGPDTEPAAPIAAHLRYLAPLSLRVVRTAAEHSRRRVLIERYRYLGHAVAFGAHLRYLIEDVHVRAECWRLHLVVGR